MNTVAWLTLVAIISGPVMAVLITRYFEKRRYEREQKVNVLRMLLTTRLFPSDPTLQTAINLIPVDFSNVQSVLNAHDEFVKAANRNAGQEEVTNQLEATETKLYTLIYEIVRHLGFKIREQDIQLAAYSSKGWGDRDFTILDGHRAMRDIANILAYQTQLIDGSGTQPSEISSTETENSK